MDMRECLIGNVCIVQCKRQADGTRYGNRRRKLSAQLLETIADVSFLLSLVVTYCSSLPALLSAPRLAETWSCLVPDDVSGTEHSASPVLRRGTVCSRTFAPYQHCVLSKIGSGRVCFCLCFNQLNFY